MSSLFNWTNSRSHKKQSTPVEITTLPFPTPAHHSLSPSQKLPYTPLEEPEPHHAHTRKPNAEPATLPRLMFIIGFFFPLCWFVGALFLSSRLRSTSSPESESGKTVEEMAYMLDRKRAAELKWAKWCLGFSVATVLAAIAVTALFCTMAANIQ